MEHRFDHLDKSLRCSLVGKTSDLASNKNGQLEATW